jgi:hypothetical protein
MKRFDMRQHTAESPSVHDQFSDANVTSMPVDDYSTLQSPDFDAIAAEAEWRATHCEACADVTPGTVVAGVHMQMCDRCLVGALREALVLIEGAA